MGIPNTQWVRGWGNKFQLIELKKMMELINQEGGELVS